MTAVSACERVRRRATWCPADVLRETLDLALEIAREGYEGRAVGTLFTVGRSDAVLACSREIILDPLAGHQNSSHIGDPRLRSTIKQLAQLDGAFVVADDGSVVAACRYLNPPVGWVHVPLGLGSRHFAAAAISTLRTIAIAVSQSGPVRVFYDGEIVDTIDPMVAPGRE